MIKVAIHSVPRSGSSFLGEIFNSSPYVNYKYQPLFSYAFKNYINKNSTKEEIEKFFLEISKSNDPYLLRIDYVKKGLYPDFKKDPTKFSHIVYKEVRYHYILENMLNVHPEVFLIAIIRNPLAVINSFFKAPKEFRSDLGWNRLEEWKYAPKKNQGKKENFFGYVKWKEAAYIFHNLKSKYPNRVFIVKYSDLIKKTMEIVRNIFDFVRLPLTQETKDFITIARTNNNVDPYSVFKIKTKDDDWKRELESEIVKEIFKDLKDDNLLIKYLED